MARKFQKNNKHIAELIESATEVASEKWSSWPLSKISTRSQGMTSAKQARARHTHDSNRRRFAGSRPGRLSWRRPRRRVSPRSA